jgi:hypothetical protein
MRVPRSFRTVHDARVANGEAPDLFAAIAMALCARRIAEPLARALEARATGPVGGRG